MFSTVSRFGQSSNSCRSSPGMSCCEGVGMTKVTFAGNKRKQRRQLSVRVRYCTSPQTLQRTTSRSMSELASCTFFSPTGLPRRPFRRREGEERLKGGRQKPARATFSTPWYLESSLFSTASVLPQDSRPGGAVKQRFLCYGQSGRKNLVLDGPKRFI